MLGTTCAIGACSRCYDMSIGATDKRYKWYEGVSIASIGGGAIGAQ